MISREVENALNRYGTTIISDHKFRGLIYNTQHKVHVRTPTNVYIIDWSLVSDMKVMVMNSLNE